jgi:hypothetical protein
MTDREIRGRDRRPSFRNPVKSETNVLADTTSATPATNTPPVPTVRAGGAEDAWDSDAGMAVDLAADATGIRPRASFSGPDQTLMRPSTSG